VFLTGLGKSRTVAFIPLEEGDKPGGMCAQVLDARDPLGTRCAHLEHHLRRNARHKHMLLLLNKCDLVRQFPAMTFCDMRKSAWVVRRRTR